MPTIAYRRLKEMMVERQEVWHIDVGLQMGAIHFKKLKIFLARLLQVKWRENL